MKRNEIGLYLSDIFFKIPSVLYSAVITALLLEQGYSMTQIGTAWSVTLFATTVLDFPTGGFADRFGRIKIYSMGMLLMSIARFIYAYKSEDLLWVYFAAFLLGAGESQVSGTMSPWYVQTLQKKDKKSLTKVFAQKQVISNLVGIFVGILISFLPLNYKNILVIAGFVQWIGAGFILLGFKDNKGENVTYKLITINAFQIFLQTKKLWLYTALITCMYSFYSLYLFIWQPFAQKYGIQNSKNGIIQSVYLFCLALGGYLAKHIYMTDNKKNIVAILLGLSVSMITWGYNIYIFLGAILLFGLSYGIILPGIMSELQLLVPDGYRASITSLMSTLSSLGLVGLQFLIGCCIDRYGYSSVVCISVICCSIVLICNIKGNKIGK